MLRDPERFRKDASVTFAGMFEAILAELRNLSVIFRASLAIEPKDLESTLMMQRGLFILLREAACIVKQRCLTRERARVYANVISRTRRSDSGRGTLCINASAAGRGCKCRAYLHGR